jgi:hypothetical protein
MRLACGQGLISSIEQRCIRRCVKFHRVSNSYLKQRYLWSSSLKRAQHGAYAPAVATIDLAFV